MPDRLFEIRQALIIHPLQKRGLFLVFEGARNRGNPGITQGQEAAQQSLDRPDSPVQ